MLLMDEAIGVKFEEGVGLMTAWDTRELDPLGLVEIPVLTWDGGFAEPVEEVKRTEEDLGVEEFG